MADLIAASLHRYLDTLIPARPPELAQMEAEAAAQGFPIIGPVAGQFCYLIARLVRARRVFELGSGFGYSTAWFARAVQEHGGGIVHHVVWDAALSARARRHLDALGYGDIVRYQVREGIEALRGSEGGFDLIFNDIDKEGYPESLAVIEDKLRPGGVLIVDNMLWSGRVLDPADRSADTEGIRELTRRVTAGDRWIPAIVPIRDGLLVAYRRDDG
jgi:caffeoyl-CoA O-methyltransferase